MERKSPYVLVGAAMIVFIAAVAGFVIWKLRAGDRTSYAYYVILFSGDVQGLTNDSPVFYRGLRVGREAGQVSSRRGARPEFDGIIRIVRVVRPRRGCPAAIRP